MFIEIFILSQLMNAPSYGYQLKKNTLKTIGPYYQINNNQLYPKLKLMEKKGYISKKVTIQEGKPNRNVYAITDPGIEYFYTLLKTFPDEYAADENEYLARIGFFDILDADVKKDILEKRKEALQLESQHMDYLTELHQHEKYVPYSKEYFHFSQSSIVSELAVIDGLLEKIDADC